ncbi:conjugal transfer protein TrbL family protein [Bacillus subtilis]|uniref:TrsL n=1 Tax=Bacillus subtilis TaxID=1423 RepID=A0A8I2BAV8_BACIU|nr:conjugal transfer protein TrbL family protein [Bacillus subtilis]MBO3796500.1 hypothetical protein [Bacillus subtilis]MCM3191282.1 hypothetical protein [Bacillus subtilis]WEY82959.1 hypothetical protein P5633_00135 [Bacillus subtilis]
MGWISDKITDMITDWGSDVIKSALLSVNELVFKMPENTYANTITTFIAGFSVTLAMVIFAYKIVTFLIDTSNGTAQYPLGEIITRAARGAILMGLLPLLSIIIVKQIALPLCDYLVLEGSTLDKDKVAAVVKNMLNPGISTFAGFAITVCVILFAIAFVMFLFSVFVFYADFLLLQICAPIAAVSVIADDNNYMGVWWREMLSQISSLIFKLILFMTALNVFIGKDKITFYSFGLAMGCCILIIKTPSLLRNMWYAGGGGKAAMGLLSGGGKLAARRFLMKM